MPTATLSTRGQIVIPAEVRQAAGWAAGDQVTVTISPDQREVTLRRKETLDEMAARFATYVKPGIPPLIDVHGLYDQREPRL